MAASRHVRSCVCGVAGRKRLLEGDGRGKLPGDERRERRWVCVCVYVFVLCGCVCVCVLRCTVGVDNDENYIQPQPVVTRW